MLINSQLTAVLNRSCCSSITNCGGGASVRVRDFPRNRNSNKIRCRFSSPNDGDSVTSNFEGGDGDYVNSTVIEAGIILSLFIHILIFKSF